MTLQADIVTHLNDNVAALTAGTNLSEGPMPAHGDNVPDQFVAVLASGGPADEATMMSSLEFRNAALQVMIRSNPHDFAGGKVLADQVRDALHRATIAGYLESEVQQSEPPYLGKTEKGSHEWSVNVLLLHED